MIVNPPIAARWTGHPPTPSDEPPVATVSSHPSFLRVFVVQSKAPDAGLRVGGSGTDDDGRIRLSRSGAMEDFGALVERRAGGADVVENQQPGIAQLDAATHAEGADDILQPLVVRKADLVRPGADAPQDRHKW